MATGLLTKFTFLLAFLSNCYCTKVPLVAWSYGERLPSPENIISGQSVEAEDIFRNYLKPYIQSERHLFLFIQDELSVDDFTIYQSSFENLKVTLGRQNSFVLPSVLEKDKSIYDLFKESGKVDEVFNSELNSWSYSSVHNDVKVVIFHLEPVNGAPTDGRKEIFKRNDEEIKKIIKSIKLDNFAVVLTSSQPSQMVENLFEKEQMFGENNSPKRHLLSMATYGKVIRNVNFFNYSDNIYMYATDISFLYNNTYQAMGNNTWTMVDAVCNGSCLNLTTTNPSGNITHFNLFIQMKNNSVQWYCDQMAVTATMQNGDIFTAQYECGGPDTPEDFDLLKIADHNYIIRVPIAMSYNCDEMTFFGNNGSVLRMSNLQLQPTVQFRQFGQPHSCIGFFTIPIYMGLYTMIVFTLILLFGMSMIMTIQTQDRFDDPKGQTISVPDRE